MDTVSLLYRGVLYVEVILYSKECNWYTRCCPLNGITTNKGLPGGSDFNFNQPMSQLLKLKDEIHVHVHQYVSENVIKIFGDFRAIFWKKPWTIALGIFQIFGVFLKWP